MAILPRATGSLKVVSSLDPALADIPDTVMQKYLLTRDLADLGDLSNLPDQPTMFTVLPLQAKKEYLVDAMTLQAKVEIVRTHVVGSTGIDLEYKDDAGTLCLTKEAIESLPMEVVDELAMVIIQAQSRGAGRLGFFTQPDTWRAVRRDIKRMSLLV